MAGIRIQLELDDGTFTTRMLHAGESLDDFNAKLGQTAVAFSRAEAPHRSFIGHMRDIIVIVAAVRLAFDNLRMVTTGWAADIIKVNAEFERLTYLLKGMSSAADPMKDATNQVRELRDLSLSMPYSMKAITDTFVKLRASGTDPMQGSLQAVIDTVAAFGGTESQLKRAALALQEMAGKGVVQTKELRRQLGQDIPRAIELMARALGLTIPQLNAVIEKGTLDAASAMQAMYGEWERTFGGSAKRLMQTFNGELQQTQTLIQNLALDIGHAGFFDETKKQLKEFNDFLAGNQAKIIATAFGNAMANVVKDVREALDWVIKFRTEIGNIAEVLAFAFGLRVVIGTLLTFVTTMRGVMTTITAFRGELQALNFSWQLNNIGMAIGKLGIAGAGISTIAGLARGAGIALTALGASLSFVSEFIIPIVAIVAAAAFAFGLFSDKVGEAYESVKKYGAVSKDQLELAKQQIKADERSLQILQNTVDVRARLLRAAHANDFPPLEDIRTRNLRAAHANDFPPNEDIRTRNLREAHGFDDSTQHDSAIIAAQKKLAETKKTISDAELAYNKQQQERAVRDANDALDKERESSQRAYDEAGKKRMLAFAEETTQRTKHGEETESITKKNQEAQAKAKEDFYQSQYDILERALQDQEKLIANGGSNSDAAKAIRADFVHQQVDLLKQIKEAHDTAVGPQVNNKGGLTEAAALEKAHWLMEKIQGDTEKYKAELSGVNGEVAEFIFKMQEGHSKNTNIFGSEELQNYINLLDKAFEKEEKLRRAQEGQQKLDHDLMAAYESAQTKLFEAQNRDKSPLEKIIAKLNAGGYSGQKSIGQLAEEANKLGGVAQGAATSMDALLGDPMQKKGRGMLGVLQDLTKEVTNFSLAAQGVKVNPHLTNSILGGAAPITSGTPGELNPGQKLIANATAQTEAQAQAAIAANRLTDKIKELRGASDAANDTLPGVNKNLRAVVKLIREGDPNTSLGSSTNPNDPQYKSVIDAARVADFKDVASEKRGKLQQKALAIINNEAADTEKLEAAEAALRKRLNSGSLNKPNRGVSAEDAKINKEQGTIKSAAAAGAITSQQASDATGFLTNEKQRQDDVIVGNVIANEKKKTEAIEKGEMTANAARQFAYNEEIKRLDELLAEDQSTGAQRIAIEKAINDEKHALAIKEAQDNPIGKEFKQWSDVGQQFGQSSAGWMNTFADDLAIMANKGKVNFQAMSNSIILDMTKIAMKGAIGGIGGSLMGALGMPSTGGGSGKGGSSGGGSGKGGGTSLGIGHAHTGGMVGGYLPKHMVDMRHFLHAARFHEGGFPGLSPDEVPIVAKKGEEVGWPDQLAKKYGGKSGIVNNHVANVTVNSNGGNEHQNQDLAEKVGRAVNDSMRTMVMGEIRTQMRNGGVLAG